MKRAFLTFADSRMHRSLKRIENQAKEMQVYDEIFICNEFSLDEEFRKNLKNKLVPGTRGYGYWSWKPQIILQTLQNLSDGDILHYCDAGCHLNKKGRKRLLEYFEITSKDNFGMLAFQSVPPSFHDGRNLMDLADQKWCKGDLLDFLKVRDEESIVNTQTIGAGIIFIKKNNETFEFIEKWRDVFLHDFSLIDDSPSKSPNTENFIEHRHDQAIFSILCKKKHVKTISAYEYWYPTKKTIHLPDWKALQMYPIHAKRDKKIGSFTFRVINRLIRGSKKVFKLVNCKLKSH